MKNFSGSACASFRDLRRSWVPRSHAFAGIELVTKNQTNRKAS
jgi:hypothetical protein